VELAKVLQLSRAGRVLRDRLTTGTLNRRASSSAIW
jgi:hypothetical protein